MSTDRVPPNVFHLTTVSDTESLDELLADENFFVDLIDLINQNFVLEVEASHAHDEWIPSLNHKLGKPKPISLSRSFK